MRVIKYLIVGFLIFMLIGSLLRESGPAVPIARGSKDDIEIVKSNSKNDQYSQHVYVTVKNNSSKLCKALTLQSIYLDSKGGTVGTGNGVALNIAAGATKVIDCMTMQVEGATHYEVQIGSALFE